MLIYLVSRRQVGDNQKEVADIRMKFPINGRASTKN